MSKKRLLWVVLIVIIMVATGLIIWAVNRRTQPQPMSATDTVNEIVEEKDLRHGLEDDEGFDVEGDTGPLVVNEHEVTVTDVMRHALPTAEAAAVQYVNQSSGETVEQRRARLKAVFHPDSPIIYNDSPPAVDPTYSKSTISNATVLYSRWHLDESYVIATVALKIVTTDKDNPERIISHIYQAWDVKLLVIDATTYSPYSLSYNDTPIILTESQR